MYTMYVCVNIIYTHIHTAIHTCTNIHVDGGSCALEIFEWVVVLGVIDGGIHGGYLSEGWVSVT